jgi:hypothetical protein
MADFLITAPNGKKYKVSGETKEGAVAALKKMLGDAPSAPSDPVIRSGPQEGRLPPQDQAAVPLADPVRSELATNGPGPTGRIDPALYEMGAIGRRTQGEVVSAQNEYPQELTDATGAKWYLDPQTGRYMNREVTAQLMAKPTQLEAAGAGALQGLTFGTGDEIAGMISGPAMREKIRAATDVARQEFPKTSTAAEIGAAASIPFGGGATAPTLMGATKAGAVTGAVTGGLYSAASEDGGVLPRLEAGLKGAVAGGIIGAAAPTVINYGSKAVRTLFGKSAARPTIESLKAVKSAAYKAVDDLGETFSPDEMATLADRVKQSLADSNYVQGVDRQTDAVVSILDNKSTQELSLGQLDKLRQNFWKRYEAAKNETGILDAIDAIDELVSSRSSASEAMDAARLANARYKKAELLDRAFQKAQDQTAATGSGGNILNKYRQAVTSIINNPKTAKWFSAEEIDVMRKFVEGSTTQNLLRRVGKLSPSGNGLMMALNLGAVSANPAMLGVTALASGAKAISDSATERGVQGLIGMVGGGAPKPVPTFSTGNSNALAPIADQLQGRF